MLVRARSVLEAPGAARLGFGLLLLLCFESLLWHSRLRLCLLFLPQFLIAGLASVLDFRQLFPQSFDVALAPQAKCDTSGHGFGRSGDFSCFDITAQGSSVQSQFFCYLMSRKAFHSAHTIADRSRACQVESL
jgi:hypothetical protein